MACRRGSRSALYQHPGGVRRGGGTFAHEAVVLEEQGRIADDAWAYCVHSTIVAHYILAYGTENQKNRWLPKLASGEMVGAIATTEPGTGSDLQRVRTAARRVDDHYVINGAKTFITNGTQCDLLIIVARTGSEAGAKGLSSSLPKPKDCKAFNAAGYCTRSARTAPTLENSLSSTCRFPP